MQIKPTFGLADIPENWEIRLREDFVEKLDRINRPWRFDPTMKRGDCVYWYISTVRKRTWDRMSQEQRDRYKRHHAFGQRLWTWRRKPAYKGGKKRGIFILKHQIATMREAIDIADSELEKVIIGFRLGIANTDSSIQIDRLPIVADENWAWLLGHAYSSSAIRFRAPRKVGRWKSHSEQCVINMLEYEPVIPLVKNICRKIGIDPYISQLKSTSLSTGTIAKRLRSKRRRKFRFGWPEFLVLQKFGLPTEFRTERPTSNMISRYWKPRIPDWVKDDDNCMRSYFEGYINGPYMISSSISVSKHGRAKSTLGAGVHIRPKAAQREYAEQFTVDLTEWLEQYFSTSVREYNKGWMKGKYGYEINIVNKQGFLWLLDNLTIARPDLRARLVLRIEAYDDPVLYEALLHFRSPVNVILGLLLEQPLTADELSTALAMKREGVIESLRALQVKGLINRRGDSYYYDPEDFTKRMIRDNEKAAEKLAQRAYKYSARLLFRCTECLRVYIRPREICGMCDGEVAPVERKKVLRSVHQRRGRHILRAQELKEVIEQ